MFELKFSNNSEKFIKKTDSKLRKKLVKAFYILHENPVPIKNYDIKKLSSTKNKYRLRIGNIRIQYSIFWEENIVRILNISKRSERTYKKG